MTPTEILQAELDKVVGTLQHAEVSLTYLTEQTDLTLDCIATLGSRRLNLEAAIAKLNS